MNTMKNRMFVAKLMALVLVASGSCSKFLDEEPQTALTQEKVFSDLNNIEPLVLGLYTSWRNTKKDRGGFMFSLGTDESQQGAYQVRTESGQAGLDRYDGFLAPSNTALQQQWDSRWPVISSAATTIYALKTNQQDPARKALLLGDASFIRAALMFEISQYWGAIPIIDLENLGKFGTARQPLPLVYSYIISDLEVAIQNLPEIQADPRRATKFAAQALLGKVYLYAPDESGVLDYGKAKENFLAVINSGKFSLEPSYANLWNPATNNSAEAVFSFQFNNVYPDNNQIQWQMGSRAIANLDQYAYFGGYDLMVPTQYAYKMTSDGGVWENGDLRKDESVRYDFDYNGTTPVVEGYIFTMRIIPKSTSTQPGYAINADPQVTEGVSATGKNHFYLDSDSNTIHVNPSQPATITDPPIGQ